MFAAAFLFLAIEISALFFSLSSRKKNFLALFSEQQCVDDALYHTVNFLLPFSFRKDEEDEREKERREKKNKHLAVHSFKVLQE